jgi:citrate lyase subunit beta/citryl-CoA lyase
VTHQIESTREIGQPQFAVGPALLFCPADRPDRYAKAIDRADAVNLDLEDAVAPERRSAARAAVLDHPLDPDRTIVRVNAYGTDDFAADLTMLRDTAYRFVMLPKADRHADLDALRGYMVVGLCETAAGVLAAEHLAAAEQVCALMWGAEDLAASLGGTSSRHRDGRLRGLASHARSTVALAAAAHGVAMIDTVHLDIADHDGLAEEAEDAAALGFAATACVHPSQVDIIRNAYRPSDADLSRARAVLAAVAAAGGGVTRIDGQMIDEPVVRRAQSVIRRAARFPVAGS